MRSWRKLRSPTDHPEMREQRTERALVRPLLRSIPCVTGKYQPVGLIACKVDVKARSSWNLLVIRETRRAISRSRGFRLYPTIIHLYLCQTTQSFDEFNFVRCSFRIFLSNFVNYAHYLRKFIVNDNKRKITSYKQKIYCFV